LETTTARVQQYKNDIPWSLLPKTFQDAVEFSFHLGVQFLWIDSLCIIQDSPEDWQHESSKMASIYEGSYITLSATVSSNSTAGLFRNSPLKTAWQNLNFQSRNDRSYDFKFRACLNHSASEPFVPLVLLGRAWAFQERLLSRHVLHFMELELWFECCEGFSCECMALGVTSEQTNKSPAGITVKLSLDQIFRQGQDPLSIERNWREIVRDYSTRVQNLTYPGDIFPALQGLVRIVPPSMGTYYAGHWEKGLVWSLGWGVVNTSQPRPKEWRAPSWSWASVADGIFWPHRSPDHPDGGQKFLQILRVNTVPKGLDPTGQLLSGEIVVIAKYLSGNVSYGSHFKEELATVMFNVDHEQFDTGGRDKVIWWDYRIDSAGPQHISDGTPVLAMKLNFRGWGIKQWMILRPIEGRDSVYERIGLLQPSLSVDVGNTVSMAKKFDAYHERNSKEQQLTII
jgi:hypothetical protein